ncbi:MAG TPA: YoaK family protein [Solirubrobacteraceae bacterium]|nr:YoaK family protein [Solirubrobacteraceae bacterium]
MSRFASPQPFGEATTATAWDPHRVRDVLLAVLALAAGSIDVLSWLALGKVFSAFMTGNVVFLAAGLFSHQSELSLHAALALCAFGAGAWVTALVMPREQASVLWPARVTSGLIACAVVQLVFWGLWVAVGGHPGSTEMVLLGISAFGMGIQTAAAVTLGVHAVFTTAVTATWTVLVGDGAHWSATRTERRRLTLVLSGTLLGALVGALLLAHLRLWMPLLPALLTSGVAVAAHHGIGQYVEPTRATVSAAAHPLDRAFGRSTGDSSPPPRGR